MKKILYMSLAVAMSGIISSCDDAIEAPTKSSMDSSAIFSVPELAEAAVMGIHVSFAETNSYRGRFLPLYGMNTDAEWYNTLDKTDDDRSRLCNYNAQTENGQMNTDNNAWAKLYEAIERANMCIEGLRQYGMGNAELEQLLGEAITLRAMIYVDLVKAWRDVPARFEPINSETVYIAKSSCDIIYKQLLADLDEAAQYLPWPNENSTVRSVERVSKAFAKGLRARVALYAGGYCQRADGSISLSTDPELERSKMYAIAKQECLEVIESGSCKLGAFEDVFHALCEDDVTAGNESIFEIPFADGRGRVLYTFGVKHTKVNKYTGQAQGGANGPIPTLFYDFDVDDARRDITCVPYEWNLQDGQNADANGQPVQALRSADKWCFGKLRYEWMTRRVTSSNDDGINWQVLRMADVYMMAAEAINELEGPTNAAQYLKPILDRALPAEKVTAYMASATASKEAFFNAIVDQRRFEFAGEMLRKMDLIRWNLLKTKLDATKADLVALGTRTGKYADLPAKLYIKVADDSETLQIYGMNHGDTDEEGSALEGYDPKDWLTETKGEALKTKSEALYLNNPDGYQFWPIWQTFIDKSNGSLVNDAQYQ